MTRVWWTLRQHFSHWSAVTLTAGAALFGGTIGWHGPAIAGSDNSSDTYAGDYQGGSLPIGTLILLQYAGYSHANALVTSAGNVFPTSQANIFGSLRGLHTLPS